MLVIEPGSLERAASVRFIFEPSLQPPSLVFCFVFCLFEEKVILSLSLKFLYTYEHMCPIVYTRGGQRTTFRVSDFLPSCLQAGCWVPLCPEPSQQLLLYSFVWQLCCAALSWQKWREHPACPALCWMFHMPNNTSRQPQRGYYPSSLSQLISLSF